MTVWQPLPQLARPRCPSLARITSDFLRVFCSPLPSATRVLRWLPLQEPPRPAALPSCRSTAPSLRFPSQTSCRALATLGPPANLLAYPLPWLRPATCGADCCGAVMLWRNGIVAVPRPPASGPRAHCLACSVLTVPFVASEINPVSHSGARPRLSSPLSSPALSFT